MHCPKCKINYGKTDLKRCLKCGHTLRTGKLCPSCGSVNIESAKMCDLCGYVFNGASENRNSHQKNTKQKRVCINGHLNDSKAVFCKWCGAPIIKAYNEIEKPKAGLFFYLKEQIKLLLGLN